MREIVTETVNNNGLEELFLYLCIMFVCVCVCFDCFDFFIYYYYYYYYFCGSFLFLLKNSMIGYLPPESDDLIRRIMGLAIGENLIG